MRLRWLRMCHTWRISQNSGYVSGLFCPFSNLIRIQASYNKIQDIKNIDQQLGETKTLETVYLEGNPAQLNDMVNYRRRLMIALPQLKQIDATYVLFSPSLLTSTLLLTTPSVSSGASKLYQLITPNVIYYFRTPGVVSMSSLSLLFVCFLLLRCMWFLLN